MADISLTSHSPATWFVVDTQTAAIATATKSAAAARRHFITGMSLSLSTAPAGVLSVTVKSGTTVIDQLEIPAAAQAPLVVNFPRPYRALNANELVSVSCPSGGGSCKATVSLRGFTTQD